jgi:hypothetical protein
MGLFGIRCADGSGSWSTSRSSWLDGRCACLEVFQRRGRSSQTDLVGSLHGGQVPSEPPPTSDVRYISAWQGRPTTIPSQEFDTLFPEDFVVSTEHGNKTLIVQELSNSPGSFLTMPVSPPVEANYSCFKRAAMLSVPPSQMFLIYQPPSKQRLYFHSTL